MSVYVCVMTTNDETRDLLKRIIDSFDKMSLISDTVKNEHSSNDHLK